jgi:ATP-binding cassette subfamily B protein
MQEQNKKPNVLQNLLKGSTQVLISHRFSTVRLADRILVLENGTLRIWYAPRSLKADGNMLNF